MAEMTDRELLELAARAAGIELTWENGRPQYVEMFRGHLPNYYDWNALTDDGDALRLAVKLGLAIHHDDSAAVRVGWATNQHVPFTRDGCGPWYWKEWLRDNDGDPCAATRRAITRAAAEIERSRNG